MIMVRAKVKLEFIRYLKTFFLLLLLSTLMDFNENNANC